jgi:hypothetical protein
MLVSLAMVTFAAGRQRRDALVPVIWFVCGAVALQLHEPVWYHHSLLLAVPASWASAAVIEDLLRLRAHLREGGIGRRGWTRVLTMLLVGFFTWQGVKLTMSIGRMFVPKGPRDQQLVEAMRRHGPETTWVFADRPIYPFSAGLVVPPEVAVVSIKRRRAGKLSDARVVGVLERYQPEQVLLARIAFGPRVMEHVREHYRPGWTSDPGEPPQLYVRRDLPSVALDDR